MEMEIDDCSVENGGNEEDSRNDSESDHDNQPNISHSIVTHTGEDVSVPSNATGDALLADNLSDVQQNILNIQNHVNATYKKHQVYDSFDALRDHMKPMATGFGFVLRRKGQSIVTFWRPIRLIVNSSIESTEQKEQHKTSSPIVSQMKTSQPFNEYPTEQEERAY